MAEHVLRPIQLAVQLTALMVHECQEVCHISARKFRNRGKSMSARLNCTKPLKLKNALLALRTPATMKNSAPEQHHREKYK